jgi:hypothetical protein
MRTPRGTDSQPSASAYLAAPSRVVREGDRLSDNGPPVPTYGSQGYTPPLRKMPPARGSEPVPPMEELPPPAKDLPERREPISPEHTGQTERRYTIGPLQQSPPNVGTPIRKSLRRTSFAQKPEPAPPMEELPPPTQDVEDRVSTLSDPPPSIQMGTHFRIFPEDARHRTLAMPG